MVVAGAFAEPEQFLGLGKETIVAVSKDVDEFVGSFLDNDTLKAAFGIDFNDSVFAEAAFDVGQGEEVFFVMPTEVVDGVGIFDKSGADRDGLTIIGKEDHGVPDIEFISGLGVRVKFVLGPVLSFWRRADEVDLISGMVGAVG